MSRRIATTLAFVTLLFAAPAMATPPAGGVYVIVNAHDPSEFNIVRTAIRKPGVDGLLVHLRWDKISDGFMHYKWTALDNAVAIATAQNKRFEIGILTDGALPSWVTDPSQGNAAHASFENNATVGKGCQTLVIAAPYDENYLDAFRDLLAKLAAHLRSTGAYASLSMIKLSGMTTTTDEMRLPAVDTCVKPAQDQTLAIWQSLGYTPGKVRSAWDSMLHAYLNNFPDKSFNIGFIGINAFPGIRSNGTIAPKDERGGLSDKLAANLIADAGRMMPARIALGFDSLILTPDPNTTSYQTSIAAFYADAGGAGARLGWQTNELLGAPPGGGAACTVNENGTPQKCDQQQFHDMLFLGVYPDGKAHTTPDRQGMYLELFPQNVNSWPGDVKAADANLAE